ncbi:MAG: cyclodeaminase/cyclohydrolase family protein [Nitrospirota bacterium]
MYIDMPFRHFMDKLASSSPEPGGGSVAAVAGALGAALVSMVANLTLGKKKYMDVQAQIESLLAASEKLREIMQELVEKDTEAFSAVSAVYKMPNSTPEEKTTRLESMQKALKKAAQVPFEVCERSLDIAKLSKQAADIGNTAVVSDAGTAVLIAHACAESAALNVRVNLKNIQDEYFNNRIEERVQKILVQIEELKKNVLETTYKKM